MQGSECPCSTCVKFPGDCEDAQNGMRVVYCEDGVIRYVDIKEGCAWWEEDPWGNVVFIT
jgi:hypothetical protein